MCKVPRQVGCEKKIGERQPCDVEEEESRAKGDPACHVVCSRPAGVPQERQRAAPHVCHGAGHDIAIEFAPKHDRITAGTHEVHAQPTIRHHVPVARGRTKPVPLELMAEEDCSRAQEETRDEVAMERLQS